MALGLPLFLPLVFCNQLGMGFWASMGLGIVLAFLAMEPGYCLAPAN